MTPKQAIKRAKTRRKLVGHINMKTGKFTPVKRRNKLEPLRDTTVGVRFAQGPNLNKVFTYRVRCPHPYKLGDPVVVDAVGAMVIAFIVRIDPKPQLQDRMLTYKWIRHQIKELWQEPPFDPDKVAQGEDEDESV